MNSDGRSPCQRAHTSVPHPPATPHTPTLDLPLTLYSILPLSSILIFTSSLSNWPPFLTYASHSRARYLLIPHFVFTCFFSIYSLEYLGSLLFPLLFFLSHTFLSYFGNNLLDINIYYPSSVFWYFLGPWESLLLNSQHRVLVPALLSSAQGHLGWLAGP